VNAIALTLSFAWKELRIVFRDRGSLAVLFLLPLIMGSLIGGANIASAKSQIEALISLKIGLVNQDSGAFGVVIDKALQEINILKITSYATPAEAENLVARGKLAAAIFIPTDFSQLIDAHTPTQVGVVVDPAQPESASIVAGIMNQVAGEVIIWGEVQFGVREVLSTSGLLDSATSQERRAVEAQSLGAIMTRLNEMRKNPIISVVSEDLQSAKVEGNWAILFLANLIPGITVMFIFFGVGATASSLLNERESGTLRRVLASPVPRGTMIAGKMLAYMLVACLQVVVLFAVARLGFGMPLGNSPLGLVVITVAVAFVATALGMLVATLARSADQAGTIGSILALVIGGVGGSIPMGSAAPTFRAPGLQGTLAHLAPHGYAVEAYYRVMAEKAGMVDVLPLVGVLVVMGLVLFTVAALRLKFDA
jgi:linearmycin/streptolysin S transport system permease protein